MLKKKRAPARAGALQLSYSVPYQRAKLHIIFELHNRNQRESVRAYAIFAGRLPNNCWKAKEKVLEGLLKNGGILGISPITPRVFRNTPRVFCATPKVF